jgi:hypothetical protein
MADHLSNAGFHSNNQTEVSNQIRSQRRKSCHLRGNHPSDPRHFPFLISTPHNSAVPTVTTGLPVAGPSFKITLSPSM